MYSLLAESPDYTLYFFIAIGVIMFVCIVAGIIKFIRTPADKRGGKPSWEREADMLAENHTADELYEMAQTRAGNEYLLSRSLTARAAERGNAQAQLAMGIEKQFSDTTEAVKWFEQAAAQGIDEAYERLGDMYNYGSDIGEPEIVKNPEEALKWYIPLAEKGNVEIQKKVALCYSINFHDDEQEIKWLLKAAESGDMEAIHSLCLAYGAKGDRQNEKLWYKKLADLGDSSAQYEMGTIYEYSDNPDMAQAINWYERAAENGYDAAKVKLAVLRLNGKGMEKNEALAVETLKKQSATGSDWATYYLGMCYLDGKGILKDVTKAIECFEKSQEVVLSKYQLALCYLEGTGVEINKEKAFELLSSEENCFDESVKYKLGEMYFFGIGTEKNREKARELWRKAAEWDSDEAKAALELHFGEIVKNDEE